jgi:phosphoenolpyruvate-protein phosphotransferase (PTS system enzyme I)
MITLHGKPASPGITIGNAYVIFDDQLELEARFIPLEKLDEEIARFRQALTDTSAELRALKDHVTESVGKAQGEIFESHLQILQDEEFIEKVINEVRGSQHNADLVFFHQMHKTQASLAATGDPYLKERAVDLRDVARRVILRLQGAEGKTHQMTEPSIVVARELTPSMTVSLDREKVLAFVTERGGRTSHAAILARALEIPSVVGARGMLRQVEIGDKLIVDGGSGTVVVRPKERVLKEYEEHQHDFSELEKTLHAVVDRPSVTKDGKEIILSANIELPQEAKTVKSHGAHGIGLFRTEYLFLMRNATPSEDEQTSEYERLAQAIAPEPLIIRTLDLGGDKFLDAVNDNEEDNPFLGWRSIRVCLDNPDLFQTQLRAILRASATGNIKIMFPLVSDVFQVRQAKAHLEETKAQLRKAGIPFDENIKTGIMIEVPSAALTADKLAEEVDFFSIGTNDLIQYTLAVDRGNARVSNLFQFFHPAVLRLITITVDAAHRHGLKVGMCGEMAGDPLACLLLLGMGLDSLSMSPLIIPEVKQIIRSVKYAEAQAIYTACMNMHTAEEIEQYLASVMRQKFPDLPL